MNEAQGIEERKFLHDIASPIGTAHFILDMVRDELKSQSNTNSDLVTHIQQLYDLTTQIISMIEVRRNILIQQGVPSSKS